MVTNKRIKTTESLQKRFFNGSKNLVIEIEKLMVHQSAAKKRKNQRKVGESPHARYPQASLWLHSLNRAFQG